MFSVCITAPPPPTSHTFFSPLKEKHLVYIMKDFGSSKERMEIVFVCNYISKGYYLVVKKGGFVCLETRQIGHELKKKGGGAELYFGFVSVSVLH